MNAKSFFGSHSDYIYFDRRPPSKVQIMTRSTIASMMFVVAWTGTVFGFTVFGLAEELPPSEKQKIEALLRHIGTMEGAVFVRNGTEYDAKTAERFLRSKWEANDATVKSSKDFVDKIASGSGTSGKPYLVRFKDGKERKSGDYLLEQLEKIQKL